MRRGYWVVEGRPLTSDIDRLICAFADREKAEEFATKLNSYGDMTFFVVEGEVDPVFFPAVFALADAIVTTR